MRHYLEHPFNIGVDAVYRCRINFDLQFTLDESNSKEKVIFRFPPGVSGKGRVTTGKAKRNKIYIGCGIIMLAAIVAIGLSFILGSKAQSH